jgi:hypothetical protein
VTGLLDYFEAHHQFSNLKLKFFTRLFAALTASLLLPGAGAAGEQAFYLDGGK